MKITFLRGFKPLVKEYSASGVTPYPMVKKVSSYEYSDLPLNAEGLRKIFELYQTHAKRGDCRLKGGLKTPLTNESRSGKTNSKAPNHSFILDFDGIKLDDTQWSPPFTGDSIRRLAQELIRLLPPAFHQVSCIAHASASLGVKPNIISMHIEFLTDLPLDPETQKRLIRYMNLTNDVLSKNIQLTATARGLRWPLDICTADNSRMIFIGTPIFNEISDPIPNPEDRFQLIISSDQDRQTVSAVKLLEWFNESDLHKKQAAKIKELQQLAGIDKIKPERTKNLIINGVKQAVVINPPALEMEAHQEYEHYITYNCNGGDSHAYYVLKNNPTVVYNWKGEPPFLFQRANEQAYNDHIETYGIKGEGPGIPVGFRDILSDTHYAGMYNPTDQTLEDLHPLARSNMDDFFADNGGWIPEPVPQVQYKFDPQSSVTVDWAARFINKWVEPPLMAQGTNLNTIPYDELLNAVKEQCPTVYDVLFSVSGCAEQEMHRFLNWLAFIVQDRDKTGIAWLFQGVQGTGKGVLYSRIIKPIFENYAFEKRLPNLEEEFNQWYESSLIVAIDEVKVPLNGRGDTFMEKFRNMITEDEQTVRAMRSNQRTIRSYANFILFTNDYDALPIPLSDRRFIICPRQETPILVRFPDIRERIADVLPNEIPTLASILNAAEVDKIFAKTIMINQAKIIMRETTLSALDEFAEALQKGDFEYFSELLERTPSIGGSEDATILIACHNTLKGWIKKMSSGEVEHVETTVAELRPLYLSLVGRIQTNKKLERALAHKGVNATRLRTDGPDRRRILIPLKTQEGWDYYLERYFRESEIPEFTKQREASS